MKQILLVILLGTLLTVSSLAQESELPGELYDVNGRALYMHCEGEGQPTVVIDAGMGEWSLHWLDTQTVLSDVTRVCVYDRDGYGASELSDAPRDGLSAVAELHDLLETAEIDEPILLVGHSLGAAHARLFASEYPDRVVGVVLVDSPTATAEAQRPQAVLEMNDAEFEQFPTFAEFASNGFIPPNSIEPPAYLPEEHIYTISATVGDRRFFHGIVWGVSSMG